MTDTTYGYKGKLPDEKLISFTDVKTGLKGLKDINEKIVLEAKYDDIEHSGHRGRGWFLCKNGKWGAVNERLEWMYPMEYDSLETRSEGGHFLKKNGKWAFSNQDGQLVTSFIYDKMVNFLVSWGVAKVLRNDKWGFIDEEGKEIVPVKYDEVLVDHIKGLVRVSKNELYGFYNLNDNLIVKPQYSYVGNFTYSHPNEAAVGLNCKWGVIDDKGNFILDMEYDHIEIEGPNVYIVKKDGLTGKINRNKEILFPFKYKSLSPFNKDGIAMVQNSKDLYGYIDKEDNLIIDFQFKYANNFNGDYALVSKDWCENYGLIDKTGKLVVPMRYSEIDIFSSSAIRVGIKSQKSSRCLKGLYDLKTGNKLPCRYENIIPLTRDRDGILKCVCKEYGKSENIFVRIEGPAPESRIAIDNYYAVVLEQNDWEIKLLGENPSFSQLCSPGQIKFRKVIVGLDTYMALTEDGRIVVSHSIRRSHIGYQLEKLWDVIDISACEDYVVALHVDGAVTCVNTASEYKGLVVSGWSNIKQVVCGSDYVVGLKRDGSLISCGWNYKCPNWKFVVSFDISLINHKEPKIIAILINGMVISEWTNEVNRWQDVIKVSAGNNGCAVGLRKDGRAYAVSPDKDFVEAVQSWRNIRDIECKFNVAVALLENGEIVCYPSRWMD